MSRLWAKRSTRLAIAERKAALAEHKAEMWRRDAHVLAVALRDVNRELRRLGRDGEDASKSRDFGRGVAYAVERIRRAERDALERAQQTEQSNEAKGKS